MVVVFVGVGAAVIHQQSNMIEDPDVTLFSVFRLRFEQLGGNLQRPSQQEELSWLPSAREAVGRSGGPLGPWTWTR